VRVAIDVQNLLRPMTGVGYYVRNLVRALSLLPIDDTIQAFYFSRRKGLGLSGGSVEEKGVRFPPGRIVQLLWKRFSFPKVDTFIRGADVFHFPNFVARPVRAGKVVVTIPDLSFMRFPQFTEPKNLSFLRRHVPQSIERAEKVVAISEFTRREIAELFPSAREKTAVTPLGVGENFSPREDLDGLRNVRQKYHVPDDYVLFVGTLEPRKNLIMLLEAHRIFRSRYKRGHDIRLVVAGMKGWLFQETMSRIREMPQELAPIVTGYVDDADLPYLYSAAKMAVVPSFYEGFGLPCLEAMACGTPLVCSNTSSMPEVVGDAALMVSPGDPEEMAQAMLRLAENEELAEELRRKGRIRAAQFTWRRCAEQTYRVYESAAGST
jgi:glycosyltransferase involved in cell wall biosynthesis